MKRIIIQLLAAASFIAAIPLSLAEDIDLYAVNSGGDVPNVLFVIDNHADFDATADTCQFIDVPASGSTPAQTSYSTTDTLGTLAGIEQCALFNAIQSIPVNTMNIGIMMFNSSNLSQNPRYSCPPTSDGGCLIYPLTKMTPANKTALLAFIKTWGLSSNQPNSIKGSNELTASAMQEAWAYYAGSVGLSTRSYDGIKPSAGCQRNFVVYVGNAWTSNGTPGDGGNASPATALASAPGVTSAETTSISVTYPQGAYCNTSNPFYSMPNHTNSSGLYADEWARYMYNHDLYTGSTDPTGIQNIVTYTVGVLNTNKCKADYPALLTSMATVGGGKYKAALSYADLVDDFIGILNEIQAVNSVFASASLPVSVNTQGTYLNQIYIGMFRPDAQGSPRWTGNLKQYQFKATYNDTTNLVDLVLADKSLQPAISAAGTGFIDPSATSFWTIKTSVLPDNLDPNGGFWLNNQQGVAKGFDQPDGQIVEKGAAGQQLRLANLFDTYSNPAGTSTNPRKLLTCTGGCLTPPANGYDMSQTPFAPANTDITTTSLGLTTASTISVTTLNRSVTTPGSTSSSAGAAKFVLSAAPSTALVDGQSVVISGVSDSQLNGTRTITLINSTTFTIAVTEYPPLSSNGGYTATVPGIGSQAISSITRSGTTATANVSGSNPFVAGEIVTFSNATNSAYLNTNFTILTASSNSFTFTVPTTTITSPTSPATTAGSFTCTTGGKAKNDTITSLYLAPKSGGGYYAVGIAANNFPCNANDSITITGTNPTQYSMTTTVVAQGSSGAATCDSSISGGNKNKAFCYAITVVDSTTPTTPDTGLAGGIVATRAAATATISSITRPASTCAGTSGVATATATATTSTAHAFIAGESVTISGTAAANESAYLGTFTIQSVPSSTNFTYTVTTSPTVTSPGCSFSTSGVQVATSTTAIDRTAFINWVRGEDNIYDELSPDTTTPRTQINIRPSVHGDVLHSRPAIINYASNKIVAFYGANDGVFHAVNANQTGNIGTTPPGGELWGFIPQEFFGKLSRLYLDSPIVKLYTTVATTPTPETKPYFFDGDVGIYQTAGSARVIIYVSARRGGRLIYAIDVTDPTTPLFLWKKGCPNLTDNVGCDAGFDELGQTWSSPKAAKVAGHDGPVVIMGAGYYGGYDKTTSSYYGQDKEPPASTSIMGRGVFVLDGLTGEILWQVKPGGGSDFCTTSGTSCSLQTMTYPISADITLIDRNKDGKIDRAYAADHGGNIWRLDFPFGAMSPTEWSASKFAALGGASSDQYKRKFLYGPDVVFTKDGDFVLIATGDREHPLALNAGTAAVINRYYSLIDPNNGAFNGSTYNAAVPDSTTWTPITDSESSTTISTTVGNEVTSSSPATTLFNCTTCSSATGGTVYSKTGNRGYFITLLNGSSTATGEKGVNQPVSIGGYTYFATNEPKSLTGNTCRTLGTARGYKIGTFSGSVAFTTFDGGGLPPSPVIGTVTLPVTHTSAGGTTDVTSTVPFLIGGGNPDCTTPDCRSSIGGQLGAPPPTGPRVRKFWYIEHDK